MLNSGKKIRTLYDKKKYSNSCCPKKNISKRKKKNIAPPLQVKWSVPNIQIHNHCPGLVHQGDKWQS